MSLKINYIPLSFINTNEEISKQIKNSVLFSHLLGKNEETTLAYYLESTQYGYTASAQPTGSHKLVRITDIRKGEVDWDNVPYCDCDKEDKYLLNTDDILVARTGGTTGKSFFVEDAPDNAVFASYLIRLRLKKGVDVDFINAFLNSYVFWSQIVEMKSGSAMPNVNAEKLKTLRLPKCDSNIQKELSKASKGISTNPEFLKIFKTIKVIENYHQDNNDINVELTHQLSLVKKLRQAFLREAMQGRFDFAQQPDAKEETGAELLAKIKAEKALRQAQGQIRKQKPLPPITKEEIPFEIPENWVWCRLGVISINRDGDRIPVSKSDRLRKEKVYDYYGASGVIDKIDDYTHDGKFVLIGEDGANLRAKSTPIAFIAEGKFWVNNHAHILEFMENTTIHFMTYCLNIIDITPFITGGFQPKLSQGNLNKLPIPLPPLSEQKAIVAKLDKLMAYCDGLEESIKNSQNQNEMLLQQVLREALGPAPAAKPNKKEHIV